MVIDKITLKLKNGGTEIQKGVAGLSTDRLYNDIEAFDKNGAHLGAIDPKTSDFYEQPVKKGENYNMKNADLYNGTHCCLYLEIFLDDYRVPIDFDPNDKRYFIPYVWPNNLTQGLLFCLWCGTKLPQEEETERKLRTEIELYAKRKKNGTLFPQPLKPKYRQAIRGRKLGI